jgi:hypothetical protein
VGPQHRSRPEVLGILRRDRDVAACLDQVTEHGSMQVWTRNFSFGGGGGSDPEAICNLCLILKIMF